MRNCPRCSGQRTIKCRGCDGKGFVRNSFGTAICPYCNGQKTETCPQCHGQGQIK